MISHVVCYVVCYLERPWILFVQRTLPLGSRLH